jgi:hypothetical protein
MNFKIVNGFQHVSKAITFGLNMLFSMLHGLKSLYSSVLEVYDQLNPNF